MFSKCLKLFPPALIVLLALTSSLHSQSENSSNTSDQEKAEATSESQATPPPKAENEDKAKNENKEKNEEEAKQQEQAREDGLGKEVTTLGGGGNAISEYNEAYYLLSRLNRGLPDRSSETNLSTPQASMENFMVSAREGDFDLAVQSLNLNLIPPDQQTKEGTRLAKELYHLLTHKVSIDWDLLPDRADGQIDTPRSKNDPLAGVPRRSIEFDSVDLEGRDVVLRVQRVKVGEQAPIWVVSPNSVENIEALYNRFGPSEMERQLPGVLRSKVGDSMVLWEWLALLVLIIASAVAAALISKIASFILLKAKGTWLGGLTGELRWPLQIFLTILFVLLTSDWLLTLSGPVVKYLSPLLIFLLIAAATWLGMRLLGFISDHVGKRYEKQLEETDDRDEQDLARSVMTRLSVARRVLILLALVVGASVMVTQLDLMDSFGGSLVLSAGVITLVLGFAARNVLGNVLAGVQIAVAQPIRIGDSVLFEGTWGWVEEITYTYVGIRNWKKQRLIVPLEYFISHPFENWTKRDSHLVKEVHLRADYTVPVDKIRRRFEEVLKSKEDWDEKNPPTVQVTGISEETVDLRLLASAKDPSTGWDLHCEIRETMLNYLQGLDGGKYLPRRRFSMVDNGKSSDSNGMAGPKESEDEPN